MLCVREFLARADGRLPVIVGVSSISLAASVELALEVMGSGAAGIMLQPMAGLKGDNAVIDYYRRFIDQTRGSVPVCVQDYPQSNGVDLNYPAWCELAALDPVFMLKHEPPAGLGKLTQIREAELRGEIPRVSILTSNNAMHLSEELMRGADGAMVGVAYSDLIVAICALHRAGDIGTARDLYDALLPLIRHEGQAAFGLAIRKEILRRRGVLKSAALRYPGASLGGTDLNELTGLQGRLQSRLVNLGLISHARYEVAVA
jgi:4-hydroxy-tetrahydrodipicolinate synthase